MQTFIVLMNYTDRGIKGVEKALDRIAEWEKTIVAQGGKKIRDYTVMGQYDRVVILEAPTDELVASSLQQVGRAGVVWITALKALAG